MPSKTLADLTPSARKALAQKIATARKAGRAWDGVDGICADPKFAPVKSAIVGRKLLREVGKAAQIAKSYDREAAGLKGPRAPKATPRKRAARKAKA